MGKIHNALLMSKAAWGGGTGGDGGIVGGGHHHHRRNLFANGESHHLCDFVCLLEKRITKSVERTIFFVTRIVGGTGRGGRY